MPNEIDALMQLDPLELSAQNLDDIIAYQRKNRLAYASGTLPRKGSTPNPIDLGSIGLTPEAKPIKRRKV